MRDAENSGRFSYEPMPKDADDDDDENFDDANETPIKPATDSAIPKPASDQSPMDSAVSLKPTHLSSLVRESSTTSRASSIKSTTATVGSVRQSSISDLEKELQEFDIDLDQDDDVSDAKSPSSPAKGARKRSTEENEVNTNITWFFTHHRTSVHHLCTLLAFLHLSIISSVSHSFPSSF